MGIVYMLCCKTTGEAYYGSTTTDWKYRLKAHRSKTNRSVSKQIIERNDYEFVILEEVDDDQLLVREKYYITTFPCINKQLPFITKEEIKQRDKQYRQDHKEEQHYKEIRKKYREEHATEIVTYAKEYYNKNKDQRIADAKQYYLENKEAIMKQRSQQHTCACGCVIRKNDIARHLKTKKHAKHLAFKATENVAVGHLP